jgi:hypothetical protein
VDRAGVGWTRRRDALEAEAVPGQANDIQSIALSPDGSEIAVARRQARSLSIIPLAGGASRVLDADMNINRGLDWGDDGFVYYMRSTGVLSRIASSGGSPESLLPPDSTPGALSFRPIALPGGRGVLLGKRNAIDSTTGLFVWNPQTRKTLPLGEGRPVGVTGDYVLALSADGTLLASRLDARSLAPASEPVAVQRNVRLGEGFRQSPVAAVSNDGVLVFATGGHAGEMQLARVTLAGASERLSARARAIRGVRVAPDGRRVAYGISGRIRIHDLAIGSTRDVMPDWPSVFDPVWSRDGRRIAFHSSRLEAADSASRLNTWTGYEVDVETMTNPRKLFHRSNATGPQSWAPDGSLIAHGNAGTGGEGDLVIVRFEADTAQVSVYLNAPWGEAMPRISPDGRWAAYRAAPEGRSEIWVRPYPDAAASATKISEGMAAEPVWSVEGRTLYYLEADNLIAATVKTSPDFAVVRRDVVLRNLRYARSQCCTANYDALPDGSGFIMALLGSGVDDKDDLIVVENLITDLDRRIPRKQ